MEAKLDKILAGITRLDTKTDKTNTNLENLTKQIENLKQENSSLKQTVTKLETKLDYLENQSRRNNIILFGLKESDNEDWNETEEKVIEVAQQYFQLNLNTNDIERAHRIGYNKRNRPIVVKFLNYKTKNFLIRNGVKLKGSNISISEDFSEKIKQERNELKPYLKAARELGARAHLNYNKLLIDGKSYQYGDLCKHQVNSPQDIINIMDTRQSGEEQQQPPKGMETRSRRPNQ